MKRIYQMHQTQTLRGRLTQALMASLFVGLMCVTSCNCTQTQPTKSLENTIASTSLDSPITDEKTKTIMTAGIATVQNNLPDVINGAEIICNPIKKELLKMSLEEAKITPETVIVSEPPKTAPEVSGDTPMMSREDIELIALVTMGEAEDQSELGKRLVIDTVLNRMDHYGDTASEVIYAKGQYTCMWDGRIEKCYVRDDIVQLVHEELENRTNYDVIYFRTGHYHNFGTRIMPEDEHYFSGF